MTVEASIVVPLIIIIIATMLVGYLEVSAMAFHEFEDGVSFLLSVSEGSSLNGASPQVEVCESQWLTGKELTYSGRVFSYRLFKPSRIVYGTIFEALHGGEDGGSGSGSDGSGGSSGSGGSGSDGGSGSGSSDGSSGGSSSGGGGGN